MLNTVEFPQGVKTVDSLTRKLLALHDFLDYWQKTGVRFEPPRSSGVPAFSALVTYESDKRNTTATTKVQAFIPGYNSGRVSLEETKKLQSKAYYLDFNPDFQDYKYQKSTHALVISAAFSEKLGAYTVTILPTETN